MPTITSLILAGGGGGQIRQGRQVGGREHTSVSEVAPHLITEPRRPPGTLCGLPSVSNTLVTNSNF